MQCENFESVILKFDEYDYYYYYHHHHNRNILFGHLTL
jgi:hypothetical protein